MTEFNRLEIIKEVSEIISETIEQKVEHCVLKKIGGIKNLIGGLGISLIVAIISFGFWLGVFSGKVDSLILSSKKINDIEDQQIIIGMQLHQIDPSILPPVIMRGTNSKK